MLKVFYPPGHTQNRPKARIDWGLLLFWLTYLVLFFTSIVYLLRR